ncbi:MAG: c-type cytochrome [Thaumarchaeota archaeon]|nr:c-type cytochrome [Nitrososphaerota archaeon]MCL5317469.1 c-type cytochrome [Nitrososphaerota archaeon]
MNRKSLAILSLLIAVSTVLLLNTAYSFVNGAVGYSGNPATHGGAICTNCHDGGIVPSVTLVGPANVTVGSTHNYTLVIGVAQAFGALDVSVTGGTLNATQNGTQVRSGELVQTMRRPANSFGIVEFGFNWTAPATVSNVTMYAAGNSVNGDGDTTGDNANKTKLIIKVLAPTTTNTTTTTTTNTTTTTTTNTTTTTTNTTTTTTRTNTTTPLANTTTVTVTSTVTLPPTTVTTTVTSAPTTVTTTRTVTQTTTVTTTVTQPASTTTSTKTVTSTTTETRTVTKTTTKTVTIHDHGKTLYKNLCASCHGSDARGGAVHQSVVDASSSEIKEAIQEEQKMKFLKFLSNNAISEISNYLKSLGDS